MKNPVRVLAGLRSAVIQLQKAVDANKADISNGIDFQHLLVENERRLTMAKAKLRNYQLKLDRLK